MKSKQLHAFQIKCALSTKSCPFCCLWILHLPANFHCMMAQCKPCTFSSTSNYCISPIRPRKKVVFFSSHWYLLHCKISFGSCRFMEHYHFAVAWHGRAGERCPWRGAGPPPTWPPAGCSCPGRRRPPWSCPWPRCPRRRAKTPRRRRPTGTCSPHLAGKKIVGVGEGEEETKKKKDSFASPPLPLLPSSSLSSGFLIKPTKNCRRFHCFFFLHFFWGPNLGAAALLMAVGLLMFLWLLCPHLSLTAGVALWSIFACPCVHPSWNTDDIYSLAFFLKGSVVYNVQNPYKFDKSYYVILI